MPETLRMTAVPATGPGTFAALDDSKITRFQYKIMFISGMGFFTDAYDLFIIGIVVDLLKPQWHLSTGQVSLLNSATLAASALGAVIFGRVADILGRKKIYGYEVLILAIGAIASALSPNYTFLLVSRVVLGIGIGGDYPVSATIMSEYSAKRSRGRMVGLVFAMQGAGLVVGPLIAALLLNTHVPNGDIWRVLLGLGAVPGLAVFYLRRQIHETPALPTPAVTSTRRKPQLPPPPANQARGARSPGRRLATPKGRSRGSGPWPTTGACSSGSWARPALGPCSTLPTTAIPSRAPRY